ETLAKAVLAASLIASGKFDLTAFDEDGRLAADTDPWRRRSDLEKLLAQSDFWSREGRDWRQNPALTALRNLTDTLFKALNG
ncbi:MAG: hypothetical protein ACRD15_06770, partial [Vicinamibacterales bacterium]